MAKKKEQANHSFAGVPDNVHLPTAGMMVTQPITQTLETNYMPYAMSVIVSRAIPEIDGFKPSHRKILFNMYRMGLLTGGLRKSADVVGRTMELNPHGDAAIYETMVRMSRGNEALLHPYVESKGNFGKAYSRDMAYAASRYTEVKLSPICAELFRDIDKDSVDFVDNYSGTCTEPVLLPARFPSVLVNANLGLAVGMATSICPFNLEEVCKATIGMLEQGDDFNPLEVIKAPDFPGGGYLIWDEKTVPTALANGRGGLVIRSKYQYDEAENLILITQIPPTTTIEAILDKIAELVKLGKITELRDMRDETAKSGLAIALELKRGQDPDKVMKKLFRLTPLQDVFSCNFNILIAGKPRVMGVQEILTEWIAWRLECVRRRTYYEQQKKKDKLHLLQGLRKILLDIDKAIHIVRETDEEAMVVPNLMVGFGIDKIQADFVAEIKLRHLNREYILARTAETDDLEKAIEQMEALLKSPAKMRKVIADELREIITKYGQPRKTMLLYDLPEDDEEEQSQAPPVAPCNLFFTKEGYFKRITPASWRMGNTHKLKDEDEIVRHVEGNTGQDLLFFTNMGNVYKAKVSEFKECKASELGEYVPAKLGMEPDEAALYMAVTDQYTGSMLFFYANGKVAKTPMSAFETKTNRRKLTQASCDKFQLAAAWQLEEECEFYLKASSGKVLLVHSATIPLKATKGSQGVAVMTLKKGQALIEARPYAEGELEKPHLHRTKTLPAAGKAPTTSGEQMTL